MSWDERGLDIQKWETIKSKTNFDINPSGKISCQIHFDINPSEKISCQIHFDINPSTKVESKINFDSTHQIALKQDKSLIFLGFSVLLWTRIPIPTHPFHSEDSLSCSGQETSSHPTLPIPRTPCLALDRRLRHIPPFPILPTPYSLYPRDSQSRSGRETLVKIEVTQLWDTHSDLYVSSP
jgi:hypothetical protein